jgi:curli biogenesis system outer membrane secretion channel CsgG
MKKVASVMIAGLVMVGCITMPAGDGGAAVDIPAPEGNLKYSISVAKFKNESGWAGRWNVGDGFGTIMTDALKQSGWFTVLADNEMRGAAMKEQDLAASGRTAGGKKAPVMGAMTPAQLLVRGSITHVQQTGSGKGGVNFKGISLGGSKASAEINMTIYIFDTTTGQVLASTKVTGTSKAKGMRFGYHGSALGGLTGNVGGEKKDNVGKACENAVAQGLVFLIKQLEKVPWEGTVIKAGRKEVMINRGKREGVALGNKFNVGERDLIRDPDTGEVLDVDIKQAGVVEVTKVKEKVAYCKILEGKPKKKMSVLPQ